MYLPQRHQQYMGKKLCTYDCCQIYMYMYILMVHYKRHTYQHEGNNTMTSILCHRYQQNYTEKTVEHMHIYTQKLYIQCTDVHVQVKKEI